MGEERREPDTLLAEVRGGEERSVRTSTPDRETRRPFEPAGLAASFVVIGLTTAIGKLLFGGAQLADVVMVYLLGVVLVSLRWGLRPSLLAAVLSVVSLDFFFVAPFHTFAVADVSHLLTFAVMFIVAVVISGLTKRVRDQAEAARDREIRTASLYSLSGALSLAKTSEDVAVAGAKHVHDVFGARNCVLVVAADGHLATCPSPGAWWFDVDDKELAVAEWTRQHGRPAGAGTDTLPSSDGSYFALEASASRVGVLAVHFPDGGTLDPERRQHLAAFARQIAGALERTRLAERAQQAQLRVEAEQLRNSLLSSVSHDLRTPLAVITGTASTLLNGDLEPPIRKELTEGILVEAERLNRLVRNLLDMTRLEAGAVEVKKEWQPLEEALGAALERTSRVLGSRPVTTDVPPLPLVPYDSILLQQVLVNLLENAAKYTPAETAVTVSARLSNGGSPSEPSQIEVAIADRGPGLHAGEERKIFEKFYRAEQGRGGGVGLGLTICKGIVMAHRGRIWAANRDGGGAAFHFTLPIEGEPPTIDVLSEYVHPGDRAHP